MFLAFGDQGTVGQTLWSQRRMDEESNVINLRQWWQDWMCHSVLVVAAPSPRLWYPRQTLQPWLLPAQSSQPCPAALQNKSNLHLYSLVYTALLTAKVESARFDKRSKSALWSVAEVAERQKGATTWPVVVLVNPGLIPDSGQLSFLAATCKEFTCLFI